MKVTVQLEVVLIPRKNVVVAFIKFNCSFEGSFVSIRCYLKYQHVIANGDALI